MIDSAEDSPFHEHGHGQRPSQEHERPSREHSMAAGRAACDRGPGPIVGPGRLLSAHSPGGGLKSAPVTGDAAFYAYQFARAGELSGQWWKMGQDDLIGAP